MRLLLLPGMDGTGRLFQPLLNELPRSLPTSVVSYPSDQLLGYQELLPIVQEAASQAGDFVVVGESFSGPLALMLAATNPRGLCGVVLCASFVRYPSSLGRIWPRVVCQFIRPWMFRGLPRFLINWLLLGSFWPRRMPAPSSGTGVASDELAKSLYSAMTAVSPAVLAHRVREVIKVNASTELKLCPAPILVIEAARDRMVSRTAGRLIASIRPDAQFEVLPGAHLVCQVCAGAVASQLQSFCERVKWTHRE